MDLKNQTQKRPIKFRGYSEELKSFVYGFFQEVEAEGVGYSYIFWQGNTTYVRADSVAQFTGMYDKNGKEIYEGDIILFQKFSNWDDDSMKRHKATVIFKEGCFMWEILEFGKKSVTYYANATEPLRNTNSIWGLEVIGNIYVNPELLTD